MTTVYTINGSITTDNAGNVTQFAGTLIPASAPPVVTPPPPTGTEYFVPSSWSLPTNPHHGGTPCIVLYPGQDNAQVLTWTIQPSDANQQSTVVAAVDVVQDGITLANPTGTKGHTTVYRLGGQAIPGYRVMNGYVYVKPTAAAKAGDVITLKVIAYDDSGAPLETTTKTVQLFAA